MAAFCVHIIKNAAKTTSKGKQNGSEIVKGRAVAGPQQGTRWANRQSEQMQTGLQFGQVLAQKICLAIRNIHG